MSMPSQAPASEDRVPRFFGTETDRRILRRRAQADLYWLCKHVLSMDKLVPHVHGRLCKWLSRRPWPGFGRDDRLIMLPRGFYKSSVCTIGATIQDILRNPTACTLIANEKVENSKNFVRSIRLHFEKNRKLRWMFPELIPTHLNKIRWSDAAFVLNRPEGHQRAEATVEAIGVGGTVVSRHYDIIRLDDLIGKDAAMSPAVMRDAKAWMRLMEHLFADTKVGQREVVGTRWANDDIYHDVIEDESIRQFILPGELEDGTPTFPEQFPEEELERIRKKDGSYIYSLMMKLNPLSPENAEFREEWLSFYEIDHGSGDILPLVDGKRTAERLSRQQLYVAGMVDPATDSKIAESKTAFLTMAKDNAGRIYVLDAWAKRSAKPEELVDAMISRYLRLSHTRIGFESNSFMHIYKNLVRDQAEKRGVSLPITDIKQGKHGEKEHRIRSLAGQFESGRVHVRKGLSHFMDEYLAFPMQKEMDVLDACYELMRPGGLLRYPDGRAYEGDEKKGKWHEEQLERHRASVNPVTGYGA